MGPIGFLADPAADSADGGLCHLVDLALCMPRDAAAYTVTRRLAQAFPGKRVLAGGETPHFNVPEFTAAPANRCTITLSPGVSA